MPTKFATFEQALGAVLYHLNFFNEWPEGTVMPEEVTENNAAARADLADAWKVRERAEKADRMLNTLAANSSEGQYGICRAIPVVQEILSGEGTYRAAPYHLSDELRKAGLGEEGA